MPTLKELKKLATQRKIKGRSKMNKAQLEAALGIKVKSRKARVKKSRKARVKKSRKARVSPSRRRSVKKSRKSSVKSVQVQALRSRKSVSRQLNQQTNRVLSGLKREIERLKQDLYVHDERLMTTKRKLAEAETKFNSTGFKRLPAFTQTRIKQDVDYLIGLETDQKRDIERLSDILQALDEKYQRMESIESLLSRRLTVREIHKLRHLISQLEPRHQQEYRDRMRISLRKF